MTGIPPADRPLVTIVIPCHGRGQMLSEALASLQAQTEPRWRAIVVDDASPRHLGSVVEALGDPRATCMRLTTNVGPGAAREAGLTQVTTRWTAFLDSDDLWRPRALARQLERMSAGPDRVLVAGAMAEDRVRPRRAARPGERTASFMFRANEYAQISGVMAPSALAKSAGFGGLRQYEDWLFLLRCEALGAQVDIHGEALVERRSDPAGDGLGARDDVDRAAAFLSLAGPHLTEEERAGFVLRCVGAAMMRSDRLAAARLAATMLMRPRTCRGAAAKLLARTIVGDEGWKALKLMRHRKNRVAAAEASG